MNPTLPAAHRTTRHSQSAAVHRPGSAPRPRRRKSAQRERLLATFSDSRGGVREVLARPGAFGALVVIDRDTARRGDSVLVAQLFPEEPTGNADLICALYVADCRAREVRCARHTAEHSLAAPGDEQSEHPDAGGASEEITDAAGNGYRLELSRSRMTIPELRWLRAPGGGCCRDAVSVRDVVAAIESYEPVLTLTMRALAVRRDDGVLSTSVLRAELARVLESPIILNRRLRELVSERVGGPALSMSEIAIRCGRTKRDRNGNESGDTSWLARRVGLLPDAGQLAPTPWIHTDVLALIARRGLAVSPREVEAG